MEGSVLGFVSEKIPFLKAVIASYHLCLRNAMLLTSLLTVASAVTHQSHGASRKEEYQYQSAVAATGAETSADEGSEFGGHAVLDEEAAPPAEKKFAGL